MKLRANNLSKYMLFPDIPEIRHLHITDEVAIGLRGI